MQIVVNPFPWILSDISSGESRVKSITNENTISVLIPLNLDRPSKLALTKHVWFKDTIFL